MSSHLNIACGPRAVSTRLLSFELQLRKAGSIACLSCSSSTILLTDSPARNILCSSLIPPPRRRIELEILVVECRRNRSRKLLFVFCFRLSSMEKGKSAAKITSSFEKLRLNPATKNLLPISSYSSGSPLEKVKSRSLVSLCLGILGQHFEDIIGDLSDIAANFPPDIKVALLAIARRRKLLNDDILTVLVESSWDILDISGSDVSDFGLTRVAEICRNLRAVDISRCDKITALGVEELAGQCHSLEILRCGGCNRSDFTVRTCLSIFKPKLIDVAEESWEELDSKDIANGAQSLRWLVWPTIDDHSKDILASECPRITVNPKPPPFGFRGTHVPQEALPGLALDDSIVKDIDPNTWAFHGVIPKVVVSSIPDAPELPMAERFRLAFVERDARLAPKRAKNSRQHQRRAEREWVRMNTDAKSIALASQANKFLRSNRS